MPRKSSRGAAAQGVPGQQLPGGVCVARAGTAGRRVELGGELCNGLLPFPRPAVALIDLPVRFASQVAAQDSPRAYLAGSSKLQGDPCSMHHGLPGGLAEHLIGAPDGQPGSRGRAGCRPYRAHDGRGGGSQRGRGDAQLVEHGAQQPEPDPGVRGSPGQADPAGGQGLEGEAVQRGGARCCGLWFHGVAGECREPDIGFGLELAAVLGAAVHQWYPPHQDQAAAGVGCACGAGLALCPGGEPGPPSIHLVLPGLARPEQHRVLPDIGIDHRLAAVQAEGIGQPRHPAG